MSSSRRTSPPRSHIDTDRNDYTASISPSPTHIRTNAPQGKVVPVSASASGIIHDGPYIPAKRNNSTRHSLNSNGSNDVHVIGKPTRDSMVENMLLSFNKMPNGPAFDQSYSPSSYVKGESKTSKELSGRVSVLRVPTTPPSSAGTFTASSDTPQHQTNATSSPSKVNNGPGSPQLSGSSTTSTPPKQILRLSGGKQALYEAGQDSGGRASNRREGYVPQVRRPKSQTTSLDITIRENIQGRIVQPSRPATAPYSRTESAPSPTVSSGSRKLHSPSPTSPRTNRQVPHATSVALAAAAAAAAAVTTQASADRLQPTFVKTPDPIKVDPVQIPETVAQPERVRMSPAPPREAIEQRRPDKQSEDDLVYERPLQSPSIRTTSDKSLRKPSTVRSASDHTLSKSDSQHSSTDGRGLKQRSSFFKRVFGQSRSNSSPNTIVLPPMPTQLEEPPQLPPLNVKSQRSEKPRARMNPNQYAGQLLYLPNLPTPSPPHEDPDSMKNLNKKPSFFRRKRKDASEFETRASVDESEYVSTMSSPSRTTSSTAEPSPSISSLRKVMNPYLLGTTSRTTSPQDSSPGNYFGRGSTDIIAEEKGIDSHVVATDPQRTPRGRIAPLRNETPRISISSSVAQAPLTPNMKRTLDENAYVIDGSPDLGRERVSIEETSPRWIDSPKRQRTSFTRLGDERPEALDFSNVQNLHSTGIDVLGLRPLNQPEEVPALLEATSSPSDDGWIMTTPYKNVTQEVDVPKAHRIWLKHSASEELLASNKWPLPPPEPQKRPAFSSSHSTGPQEVLYTPAEPLATVVESPPKRPSTATESPPKRPNTAESAFRGGEIPMTMDASDPTQVDRQRAQKIFDGPIAGYDHDQAAAVLGDAGLGANRLRKAYMELYDFAGTNILLGMRELCGRLALKGETQQVDRILLAFSQRWTECNPDHGFRTLDVIHTLCYSLLLLNTDLHVADLEQKMTRGQFVKNTLFAISQSVEDSDTDSTVRSLSKATTPLREDPPPLPKSPLLATDSFNRRPSFETRNSEGRLSVRTSTMRPMSTVRSNSSPTPYDTRIPETGDALMSSPFRGSQKAWEAQLEILLKDFYTSIRLQRLPLFGAGKKTPEPGSSPSAAKAWLSRSGSTVSKSPAETLKGLTPDFRTVGNRWGSKSKSRPMVYSASTINSSSAASRTSIEDPSFWTSSPASTWSKSYRGKPAAAMSTDSLGTHTAPSEYGFQQSIGFANALNHAIIREETMSESESDGPLEALIEDEELGLAGAPWAKEGIVQYKRHLEETDKKYRDRNWSECFAVVEKGCIHLFSFNTKASFRKQKKGNVKQGAIVGGGNWTENAEVVDNFMLRQTIANILPSPGYSKTRPHVFALSLPNGAVHFFQVGTPEIAAEFVATANYWSARLSKEPLMGGISNVEYGWGEATLKSALAPNSGDRPSTTNTTVKTSYPPSSHNFNTNTNISLARPSGIPGSIRNSLDGSSMRPRMPGDRLQLNDWTPPQQSLMASTLTEDDQLEALRAYVHGVEEELERHNELRPLMLLAFSNRHPSAPRAMNNWERKSSYLLREIVKFRTYIDSLTGARAEKRRVVGERNAAAFGAKRVVPATRSEASVTPTPTFTGESVREQLGELSLGDDEGHRRGEGKTM